MTEVTLHAPPPWREVVLEQIRFVGLSLRREALVLAMVLAMGTVVIVGDIVAGGPGFDSRETFPTFVVSFLAPFAVWRGERRFGPAFLWTLPVDRQRLALARVFAGLVWIVTALAVYAVWLFVLTAAAQVPFAPILARIPLIPTIAAYLFGSALVLGLRHPLRWLSGAAGLLFFVGYFNEEIDRAERLLSPLRQTCGLWETLPDPAQWLLATLLWLGAGLCALWAAVSRHKENR